MVFTFLNSSLSRFRTYNILKNSIKNILIRRKNFPNNKLIAEKSIFLRRWEMAKKVKHKDVENFLIHLNTNVPTEWVYKLALPTQVSIKESKTNFQHGFILYKALTNYIINNKRKNYNIIEIGTAKGFSSLCMAKALDDLKVNGFIQTIDVLPHDMPMYWNSIMDHDGKQSRQQLLNEYKHLIDKYINFLHGESEKIFPTLDISRIHFAFIDGEHFYDNVISDGENISKKQEQGDILIFDDYTDLLFPGVVRAANEICEKFRYKRIKVFSSDERAYLIAEKL